MKVLSASQLRSVLTKPETATKAKEISMEFAGRKLLLGVDDMDLFKGIGIKLLAMVLVQVNNPPRTHELDIDTVRAEVEAMRDRINRRFSMPGYVPILLIDGPLTAHDELAYYTSADICIVTAARDGLNRIPYTYTLCRGEGPITSGVAGARREGAIILSELVGCSLSLSGAVNINSCKVDDVMEGMISALLLDERHRQMWQEDCYRYVVTHDADQDLQGVRKGRVALNFSESTWTQLSETLSSEY